MKKQALSFALTVLFALPLTAADTLSHTGSIIADKAAADSTVRKKGFINRILDYFNDANKTDYSKKFDFSIIGGPHYSSDTQLGIGLVAAGLYRTDRNDTILPPSNMSLFGDVSTVGFYMLGVRGLHIFPHDRYRLDYTLYFYSFPCKYWGMGYANGDNDDNESDMKRWQAQAKASFLFRVARNTYVGPMLTFDFIQGKDIKRPELLEGMDRTTRNVGVGLTFAYDSRDVTTNPKRGIYVSLSQNFRPAFLQPVRLFHHRPALQRLPPPVERGHPRHRPAQPAQLRKPLMGHDGSSGELLFHARLLRGTLPRQAQDRGAGGAETAHMEAQQPCGVGRGRNGVR